MKNYILFFIGLLTIIGTSRAQNAVLDTGKLHSTVIYLPDYYKEKGVIFDETYLVGIDMQTKKRRYTPSEEDVAAAEAIFHKQYNQVRNTNVDTKQFFCRWVRQYVGLIDTSGNKNIIVQLINNEKPRKIRRMLGREWERVFIILFTNNKFFENITFRINIDKGYMTIEL